MVRVGKTLWRDSRSAVFVNGLFTHTSTKIPVRVAVDMTQIPVHDAVHSKIPVRSAAKHVQSIFNKRNIQWTAVCGVGEPMVSYTLVHASRLLHPHNHFAD